MQIERILSDLIADVPLIGADDSSWPKDDVQRIPMAPYNKRLQLTPNSSFQSDRGAVLAAGVAPRRWQSALLGAAEPHVRWAAEYAQFGSA